MGGVDVTGPHLYEIAAHGSTSKVNQQNIDSLGATQKRCILKNVFFSQVPYCTMGSGTLAAMSVLESRFNSAQIFLLFMLHTIVSTSALKPNFDGALLQVGP